MSSIVLAAEADQISYKSMTSSAKQERYQETLNKPSLMMTGAVTVSTSLSEGDHTPQVPDVVLLGKARIPSPPTGLENLPALRDRLHQPTRLTHSPIHVGVRGQILLAAERHPTWILASTAPTQEAHTVGAVDPPSTMAASATSIFKTTVLP